MSFTGILWARCPCCHPANSDKGPKETQGSHSSHWPGFILSSSTAGLLVEGAFLHLHCLTSAPWFCYVEVEYRLLKL